MACNRINFKRSDQCSANKRPQFNAASTFPFRSTNLAPTLKTRSPSPNERKVFYVTKFNSRRKSCEMTGRNHRVNSRNNCCMNARFPALATIKCHPTSIPLKVEQSLVSKAANSLHHKECFRVSRAWLKGSLKMRRSNAL